MLDALARLVTARPVVVLCTAVGLTLAVASFAPQAVQVDGNDAFAPDTPELAAFDAEEELFGEAGDVVVQILVGGEPGDDVVSPEGLADARSISAAVRGRVDPGLLAERPGAPAVQSWFSAAEAALAMAGRAEEVPSAAALDLMVASGLRALPPVVAAQLAQLTSGEDPTEATTGIVIVRLDRSRLTAGTTGEVEELQAITAGQQQVVDAVADLDTTLQVQPFAFELLFTPDEDFQAEIGRLFGLAFAVIALVLLAVFRLPRNGGRSLAQALRRSGADTLLAMLVALLAIAFQQGAGVLLGPHHAGVIGHFSSPTQVVPVLLVALGVDYAIHLQERYRDTLAELGPDAATREAVSGVGPALALASTTTAIGFLTNLLSPTPAIRDLGALAAIGLVAGFALAVTAFPTARLLLDRRAARRGTLPTPPDVESGVDVVARFGGAFAGPALRRPVAMLAVAALLAVAGAAGLATLRTAYDFTDFVPEDAPLLAAFDTLQRDFGGGLDERTSVVVRGEGVGDPAVHNAVLAAEAQLADVEQVAAVAGVPVVQSFRTAVAPLLGIEGQPGGAPPGVGQGQIAAAIARARAAGLQRDLTIAPDGDVAAVYTALEPVAPTLASVAAFDADGALVALRLQASTPLADADVEVPALRRSLRPVADGVAAAGDVTVDVTSQAIVQDVSLRLLSDSQVTAILTTLLAVTALLIAWYGFRERRPLLGALLILPVACTVLWTFGVMALLGLDFDPVTSIVSALVVGIGIDYVIHLGERFTQDLRARGGIDPALRATLTHTGGALAASAATTVIGFAVLMTASLPPFVRLGLIITLAIGLSLTSALVVGAPLLVVWARWRGIPEHAPAPGRRPPRRPRHRPAQVPPPPPSGRRRAIPVPAPPAGGS